MNIDLLSKMVRELILDKDEVTLPGVGSFVTEIVPSAFSDKGYTINPPYRRLYFRQRQNNDDKSLVNFYAASNGIGRDQAERIIIDFLGEMKEVLQNKKVIIFPGLGKLRATKENNFFFVADEELDIWPAGFALEPISLKTHVETQEEVSAVVSNLKDIIAPEVHEETPAIQEEVPTEEEPEAVETIMAEENPIEELPSETIEEVVPEVTEEPRTGEDAEEPEVEEPEPTAEEPEPIMPVKEERVPAEKAKKKSKAVKALLWILGTVIVLILLYVLVGRLAPDFIDTLLYNQEDLEFLRSIQ